MREHGVCPDGGPYDETPPKFVRATPEPNATNNKRKKISIEFDEYIKLDKASEKVIISPPQNEAPEVKVSGTIGSWWNFLILFVKIPLIR